MGKASRKKREAREEEARHEALLKSNPKYAAFWDEIKADILRKAKAKRGISTPAG